MHPSIYLHVKYMTTYSIFRQTQSKKSVDRAYCSARRCFQTDLIREDIEVAGEGTRLSREGNGKYSSLVVLHVCLTHTYHSWDAEPMEHTFVSCIWVISTLTSRKRDKEYFPYEVIPVRQCPLGLCDAITN
jgi:hypothetical protein